MKSNLDRLIEHTTNALVEVIRGGPGSGFKGHAGRPGEVGGSAPSGQGAIASIGMWSEETKSKVMAFIDGEYKLRDATSKIVFNNWLIPSGHLISVNEHAELGRKLYLEFGPEEFGERKFLSLTMNDLKAQGFVRVNFILSSALDDKPSLMLEYDKSIRLSKEVKIAIADMYWAAFDHKSQTAPNVFLQWIDKGGDVQGINTSASWNRGQEKTIKDMSREIGFRIDRSMVQRGGPGSGFRGHVGRPGEVGGSAPKGTAPQIDSPIDSFQNDVTASYEGQINGSLIAFNENGDYLGHVDWREFEGDVDIAWITVKEDERRKGIATELIRQLQKEFEGQKILPTMSTNEGTLFLESIKDEGIITFRHLGSGDRPSGTSRKDRPIKRGGPGSGFKGHEGRPGKVGGSQPENGNGEFKAKEGVHATWLDTDDLVLISNDNGDGTFDIDIISGSDRGAFYRDIPVDDLEEADEDVLNFWTEEGSDASIERAIESFGLTNDPNEAGYILSDGTMLNFSGSNIGGSFGTRALDHRDIGRILLDSEPGGTEGMVFFMDQTNSVRMNYGQGDLGVDFAQTPTRAQRQTLEFLGADRERIFWDMTIYNPETTRFSVTGSGQINAPDIDDIQQMFRDLKTAELGERSFIERVWNYLTRHLGPGDHPSGSPQSVHAGNGTQISDQDRLDALTKTLSETGNVRRDRRAQEFVELSIEAHLGRNVSVSREIIDKVSYSTGFVVRDDNGTEMTIQMGETIAFSDNFSDSEMGLSWIDANNKGTGMGTAYMEAMKDYSDAKGINFRIVHVTNHRFYQRFNWLEQIETGLGDFIYRPSAKVERTAPSEQVDDFDLREPPHSQIGKRWPPIKVVENESKVERGGPGSGFKGHEGRPGEIGGSQPAKGDGEPAPEIDDELSRARLVELLGENKIDESKWEQGRKERLENNPYAQTESETLQEIANRLIKQIEIAKESGREEDLAKSRQLRKDAIAEMEARREWYRIQRQKLALREGIRTGKLTLTEPEMAEVLARQGDVYIDARLSRPYEYTPDLFLMSDISGRWIRHYVNLPDGRVAHPDELALARQRGNVVIVGKERPVPIRDWTKE